MLLMIDNYDSFTYNLVQYLGELGAELAVYRNDAITMDEVERLAPTGIVVSPGPGAPRDAGISMPVIRRHAGRVPILGVCLGHQAIAEAYGGKVIRASRLMHGKTTSIRHEGQGIFGGVPNPLEVMRYHSLVVSPRGLPEELVVTASSADRPDGEEIMALRHRRDPVFGVQFHPESVGTEEGKLLVSNFLTMASHKNEASLTAVGNDLR
jgi:anthranilate synthase/aminodeoxychorismate synthase-like glutamine amidotransferase